MKRLLLLLLLLAMGRSVDQVAAQACPRPSDMTAPWVGPWQFFYHADTYQEMRVHFTLHDQFGDLESPLILYRPADGIWRTPARPDLQPTDCVEQYRQLIDFSLAVLNEGQRPFTYDNHEEVADYEAFLLSKHEWRLFLPMVIAE